MDVLFFFRMLDKFLAVPSTILFLTVGVYLTFISGCVQFRAFPRLFTLLSSGVKHHHVKGEKTINPFHALLTAMATTIGMGNIVGPSVAIKMGGPGALFWLLAFSFLGSVTKFTEVMFSMKLRTKLPDGNVLGGPTQYLKNVSGNLAKWYGGLTIFLFAGWSAMQSNTLASIFYLEGIEKPITGFILAVVVFAVLSGGIQRIGEVASKLVPIMFVAYVSFSVSILLSDPSAVVASLWLVGANIFTPAAAVGGFAGATIFSALHSGILRNMHITEAGLGSSSIPHAMSDTDNHRDQAILAMFSTIADMILCTLSGLLVMVTGIWMQGTDISNTLVYEVFRDFSPALGKWVLLASISLFVLTTVIGNSFNATQSFASFTRYHGMKRYRLFLVLLIFAGAMIKVPLIWAIMDVIMVLVAIPHVIGLIALTKKYKGFIR